MVHVYFTNKSNYLFHKDDVDTCIMNRTHDQELAALVELKEVLRFFFSSKYPHLLSKSIQRQRNIIINQSSKLMKDRYIYQMITAK
jgi:hypothetical protein